MKQLVQFLQTRKQLWLILLLYIALGVLYNISLPLFESPDEFSHFRYVHWLAEERRLPDMTADYPVIGHEILQPSLYYALLAPVVAAVDRSDLETVAPFNHHWRAGGGRHVHYHTSAEQFPYRQTTLAVRLARLASTLLGSLVVISAYELGRLIAPRHAVVAAGLAAFNPQFLSISAAVSNDAGIAAFSGLALLILMIILKRPSTSLITYLLLGAVWGMAIVTKVSGLALGGVIVPGLCLAAVNGRSWRPLVLGLPVVTMAMAVLGGWHYARNWLIYSDPLAWEMVLRILAGSLVRAEALSWPETLTYAAFLRRSYWAAFGHGIFAPELFYQMVNGLMIAALIGLGIGFAKNRSHLNMNGRFNSPFWTLLLLAGWQLIVFISLLNWMRQVAETNQGRLLFPAAAALAVLLAVGLDTLNQFVVRLKKPRPFPAPNYAGQAALLILAAWAAALPFLSIQPAFAQPNPLPLQTAVPNPVNVHFGPAIQLLGYQLATTTVKPGESLPINLYWQALAEIGDSYAVALHVVDANDQVVARLDAIPYDGRYPTIVWPPHQPFQDEVKLPPLVSNAAPGLATVWLTVYPWGSPDQRLPIYLNDQPAGHTFALTQFKIAPTQPPVYTPGHQADTQFGQLARLTGYDWPDQPAANEPLPLILYWEAVEPDGRDYAVFVHLFDLEGNLLAQADGPPQNGRYPTTIWTAGRRIRDERPLSLAEGVSSEQYRLLIGFYERETGERLVVWDGNGRQLPNGAFVIEP